MDALETDPIFTLKRTWYFKHTHKYKKYKKQHANGQYNKKRGRP